MSYRDNVDFGLVGDRELMRDAWPLMEGLERSLDELCEVICKKKRQPKRTQSTNGSKPHRQPAGTI
jgi:hypothetical protein